MVPAGAPLYIGATVQPSGSSKSDTVGVARQLTGLERIRSRAVEAAIDALAGHQARLRSDIQPWLGSTPARS